MDRPVPYARTLVTEDGVPIDAAHVPGDDRLGVIVAHGFTQSWSKPMVWRIATRLSQAGGVVSFDFRGHGRSGGLSTLGDSEIKDLDVAVRYARELGYRRIAAVGFSMGASIVLRYAGLAGGLDAVVSVSGPGRWYYRGTRPMRLLHLAVERPLGRLVTRTVLHTRVNPGRWNPIPMPPAEAAARIKPVPLLVVHGDKDPYFPLDHAQQIYEAAGEPKELWIEQGYGHAETAASAELIDRVGEWVAKVTAAEPPDAMPTAQEG
jgi:pimeloyl-ACP methyl ester carboxylesterase